MSALVNGYGALNMFMVFCCGIAIAVSRQEILLLRLKSVAFYEATVDIAGAMQMHELRNGSPARKPFINILFIYSYHLCIYCY